MADKIAFLARFSLLLLAKVAIRFFYRFEVSWVGKHYEHPFRGIRVGMILNHTSLFEPLFVSTFPVGFLKDIALKGVFPGADKTMNRPFAGQVLKLLAPKVITVTRRRDDTWSSFMDAVGPDSLVLIAPEGRMKRRDGLDSTGRPMTVRGGIVEVFEKLGHGRAVIAYSGGLHHIQAPGEGFPKLFKTLKIAFEAFDIEDYLETFRKNPALSEPKAYRQAIIRDLEIRRDKYCPK